MLTRPPPSLPVLPAALLPRWPAFELNSEKRRVSIWQYARGEDAPIQEVKTQLENNTFDPAHFDMLHVLNGLKYALRSPATSPKQRVLASQTWYSLYPRASPQDRTDRPANAHRPLRPSRRSDQSCGHPQLSRPLSEPPDFQSGTRGSVRRVVFR